ncbi:MAG: XrtA/PEP-CTERM system histidine kinase PrsK [Candidatus Tectimicrobiota bacterium]
MVFHALLAWTSALLSTVLALFVVIPRHRTVVHWSFTLGMGAVALTEAFTGLGISTALPADIAFWKFLSYVTMAVLPGSWLLFSLSFGRANYQEIIHRWRYALAVATVCPVALVLLGRHDLFADLSHVRPASLWFLPLGWAGYLLHFFLLLSSVVILMHLERTLRALAGHMRWQNKFMVLGLGTMFAARIYTSSQALLFSSIGISIEAINSYATIIAAGLMVISLVRNRHFNTNIHFSRAFLHNSITVFVVGVYLLTVGFLTKAIDYFGGSWNLPVGTFFVFLALLGLSVVLLSDELRHRVKWFVNRHIYRSRYDYREAWTAFTGRTATVMNMQELCSVVCQMISETFSVPSVTLWLRDEEAPERVIVGGSTLLADTMATPPEMTQEGLRALGQCLSKHLAPLDVETSSDLQAQELRQAFSPGLRAAHIRYGVGLVAGQQGVGFLTLSDRHTQDTFTFEDYDLLKTMADQTAATVLNLQLLQRVVRAKQMETFQALSAFFVHDLKNLAAKLSLMVQNLPLYYDNPEFRDDALGVIAGSVSKMNAMCGRLSLLTRELELHRTDVDLNLLVQSTISDLPPSTQETLAFVPGPLPLLPIDPEQIQKVIENLLLNASEAVGEHGAIWLATSQQDDWAVLTVCDDGCGMSQEFLEHALFHPFQTTKSHGMGIGLFHSRTIVEAHHGHIEVESQEGTGSTFRVFLPVKG